MTTPIPEQLASIIYPSYAPWWGWCDLSPKGNSVTLYHDTEGGTEGRFEGRTVLNATKIINAASVAAGRGQLCCVKDIAEFGIEMGCAEDGDIIAQYAVFGKVVFG